MVFKKGAGFVGREFWRRNRIIITLDTLKVPAQVQRAIPWVRDIRAEFDEEIQALMSKEKATQAVEANAIAEANAVPEVVESLYRQYRCHYGNPLACDGPRLTLEQKPGAKYCLECSFPAILPQKLEILGDRGRYRVQTLLRRRGMGRLYQGIQVPDEQLVTIKEYLLPTRCFNADEARARKQAFVNLAGLNLADGRVQDFRLISPWDAIGDRELERCYLITPGQIDSSLTLRAYLALHGPMTAGQVRQVLNQILQTLESLHGQKFTFPGGQVQRGLPHGNLTLDSLLIVITEESESNPELSGVNTQFFIYLCDLALWEKLFEPPPSEIPIPKLADDLVALGYVAFYLLAGRSHHPTSGFFLNPLDDRQWPSVPLLLKEFILRLLRLGVPFESAEAARKALLQLPPEMPILVADFQPLLEKPEKVKFYRTRWFLISMLALVALAGLLWFLFRKPQTTNTLRNNFLLCCFKEVPGVPPGKFTYTGERQGIWSYVLRQRGLTSKEKTLEDEMSDRQPQLKLTYQPQPTSNAAIEKVALQQSDFAIATLLNPLNNDLAYKEFAYDSLIVFVPFSYPKRNQNLPSALNGQITFDQLRKIYTGQIINWKELGGPDLTIKLYIPTEPETVRIFEQLVLKDEQYIAGFRNLPTTDRQPSTFYRPNSVPAITPLSTFETLQEIIQDFENGKAGGISFGTLSKVFGQCSVYPLAVVDDNSTPVQALVQDNGDPIAPSTDLCDNKGSYIPNIPLIKTRQYPLAYPLGVVYLRDNRRPPAGEKFADLLRTLEGQRLLSQTGLIPLQPLPPH